MPEASGVAPAPENSGISSGFHFLSYKIDQVDLKVQRSVEMLEANSFDGEWNVTIALRKPLFYSQRKIYICGLECTMSYPTPADMVKKGIPELVSLKAGMAGIFRAESGRIPPDVETRLVKIQAPYILLPYLRGAMTSLLANSGIGAMIFPLVNLHEIAKEVLKDESITIRDA
jgi:hypothetical protein